MAAVGGCKARPSFRGAEELKRAASEMPPCRFPPLSDSQVHDAVVKNGEHAHDPGLPPPIWQVYEIDCIYAYDESAFYTNGKPSTPQMIDWSNTTFVARDGKVIQ